MLRGISESNFFRRVTFLRGLSIIDESEGIIIFRLILIPRVTFSESK
jgi:hypothetical protein